MRLLAFILMLVTSPAWATTYYVSTSGSDSNSCATAQSGGASAKRNPGDPSGAAQGGVNCLSAGDTLIIQNGTYTSIGSLFNNIPPGTGEATRTTIKCENARLCELHVDANGFYLRDDDDYITLRDMIIDCDGGCLQAITLNPATASASLFPSHVDIINNEIRDTGNWCLYDGHGEFNKFNYNVIHDCPGVNAGGIYGLGKNSQYIGNTIYNVNVGISFHSSGGFTPSGNTFVENLIYNCNTPGGNLVSGVVFSNTTGNTVRNNVIYGCTTGMKTSAATTSSNLIDHNTLYNNTSGIIISHVGSANNLVRNNLIIGSTTAVSICGGCGTATDNRSSGTATDLFTAPGSNDFTLKAGSAAINDGTDISLAYNGAAPDHGAFETFVIASAEVGLIDATSLILTFTNNVQPPLLPASGITGFTVTENASPITVSSCARTGDNIIDCTLGSSIVGGRTVLVSYSGGNVTDSSLVGNTWNQPLHTITDQAVTNNVGGGSSAVLTQTYYRFHHLLGTEDAPVVLPGTASAVNTPITINPGGKVRLRLKVACTAADCDPLGMFLRYSLNSGGYSTVVPDAFGADNIRFIGTTDTSVPTNGTATTEQLTSDHASMVACALVRTSNAIPSIDLSQNSETECEYVVEVDSDASAGDTYDFRLYSQTGTALSAYTVTPRITVQRVASGGR